MDLQFFDSTYRTTPPWDFGEPQPALIPVMPRQVREDELRGLFAPEHGWSILALRPAAYRTRSPRGEVPAAACRGRAVVAE